MSHKLYDNVKVERALDPDVRTAAGTGEKVVDTQGYRDGMMVAVVGDVTDTGGDAYTLTVMECDTSTGTFVTTGISIAFEGDGNSNQVEEVRIPDLNVTRKRFLRVDLAVSATTTSFEGGALILLGEGTQGAVNSD